MMDDDDGKDENENPPSKGRIRDEKKEKFEMMLIL
jgi:hypothetical protein